MFRRTISSTAKQQKRTQQTYYEILQVSTNSSLKEIKSQYFKLCLLHHPDSATNSFKNDGASDEFHQILQAYDTLRDSKRRREYDRTLALTKYQNTGQVVSQRSSRADFEFESNFTSASFWTKLAERRRSEKAHNETNNNENESNKNKLHELKVFRDRILILGAIMIGYFLSNIK